MGSSTKDPYIFDFLNLKNTYLELGKGFAFMDRQKRMIIDGDDF